MCIRDRFYTVNTFERNVSKSVDYSGSFEGWKETHTINPLYIINTKEMEEVNVPGHHDISKETALNLEVYDILSNLDT